MAPTRLKQTTCRQSEANKSQLSVSRSSTCHVSIKVQRPLTPVPRAQSCKWMKTDVSPKLNFPAQQENDNPAKTDQLTSDACTINPSTNEGQEAMKNHQKLTEDKTRWKTIQNQQSLTSNPPTKLRTFVRPMSKQHLFIMGPYFNFQRTTRGVSCLREGNMRHLHIPKLKLCQISMKPLSLSRSSGKFCNRNCIEVKMQL